MNIPGYEQPVNKPPSLLLMNDLFNINTLNKCSLLFINPLVKYFSGKIFTESTSPITTIKIFKIIFLFVV